MPDIPRSRYSVHCVHYSFITVEFVPRSATDVCDRRHDDHLSCSQNWRMGAVFCHTKLRPLFRPNVRFFFPFHRHLDDWFFSFFFFVPSTKPREILTAMGGDESKIHKFKEQKGTKKRSGRAVTQTKRDFLSLRGCITIVANQRRK